MKEKMEALETAKKNVYWLLEHNSGVVDMHGITYWAGRVERIREELKALL